MTLISTLLIRISILLLFCVLPELGLAQQGRTGGKKLYLPAQKGKVLVYENHSEIGKYLMDREYLGKAKTPGKEAIFLQTRYLEDKIVRDTVEYFRLRQCGFHGTVTRPATGYDSVFAYRGCIPTYLDTLHLSPIEYWIKHKLHFMEYVMVGSNRFNNVLVVNTDIQYMGASLDPGLITSMEFYYASKIGLVAQVNSNREGKIIASLELKYPKKGKWVEFHENGGVSAKMKYKNGERHGKYRGWHATGYLQKLWKYEHGNLQGEQLEYYDGELVKSKRLYELGELQKVTLFHENKQPSEEGRYKEGKRYGVWRKWDETGKMIAEAEYVMGRVVDGYWPP